MGRTILCRERGILVYHLRPAVLASRFSECRCRVSASVFGVINFSLLFNTFYRTLIYYILKIILGNTGKKADRKDDNTGTPTFSSISSSSSSPSSSSNSPLSSSRPGRGRYRNFPPTEPEIHRGGFVPLPRGQGGFVPIMDPRIEQQRLVNNGSKGFNKENESGTQVLHERKNIKTTNYTLGKVERTTGPLSSEDSTM